MTQQSFIYQLEQAKKMVVDGVKRQKAAEPTPTVAPVVPTPEPVVEEPTPSPIVEEPIVVAPAPVADAMIPVEEPIVEEPVPVEDEVVEAIKNNELGASDSLKVVAEHFLGDDITPIDSSPRNIYTKVDKALTSLKRRVTRESFGRHHWCDIAQAIVAVMAIIFLTFIVQLLTGAVRICFNKCSSANRREKE
jgi:hypothetical protein